MYVGEKLVTFETTDEIGKYHAKKGFNFFLCFCLR